MKRTKKDIEYRGTPCGPLFTIPAHTPVIPADNLPQGGYWAEPWANPMEELADSHLRNYGFHLTEEEVEEVDETDLTYLGSFNFIDLDDEERVVIDSEYDIRVLTDDEAEDAITGKYDSYVMPLGMDVVVTI